MDESGYRLEICQRHELCLHQLKHLLKKVCVRCFYQSSIESYYTKTQSTQINQHLSCTLTQTTHLGSQPETTTGTQKEQTMQDILKTLTPREHWPVVIIDPKKSCQMSDHRGCQCYLLRSSTSMNAKPNFKSLTALTQDRTIPIVCRLLAQRQCNWGFNSKKNVIGELFESQPRATT